MIYTPDNCPRGTKVFVDGVEVSEVCMADTDQGLVEYYPKPLRLTPKGDEIYRDTMSGKVTVEFPR